MILATHDYSMNEVKQIVFEVEETVVLRSGEVTIAGFCPMCCQTVGMATPWIAAAIHESSEREIFRMVELGLVHFIELDRVLVCLNSLNTIEGEIKQ
ncbi:MAG: hypothetical protein ACT4O9_07090 [Blastocatellia bacterium]